jgi:cysteine-S-conjugate beta-lyase
MNLKISTKLIHNGFEIDKTTGAVSLPIHQASTFHQFDLDGHVQYDYARSGNPTREALESIMAVLEGGECAYAFASGMAATSAVLSIFSSGDHIVCCQDVYGGTFRALTTIFSRFGIGHTFVDATDLGEIERAIRPNTKALFLETPSNPLLRVTDIRGSVEIARNHGLLSIIDNTFMSPYLQRPLELGMDIVIHSGTKFLGGHSDLLSGIVVTKTQELGKRIYAIQNGMGGVLAPNDSWLLMRGIKTLRVRMEEGQKTATKIAEWFRSLDRGYDVYYPGLEGHPGRDVHMSQADGPGAVLSVDFKTEEEAKRFMANINIPVVAVSLGGVETIVSYPARMSHASIPRDERLKLGIGDGLVRISAGLEDADDLIEDFRSALVK